MAPHSHPFSVGQEVLLFDGVDRSRRRENPLPAVITRVGRVNVAIERYGREVQFEIATGVEKRSIHAGGEPSVIRTPEQWEEEKRHKAVLEELRELGIDQSFGRVLNEYSTSALVQVRDILAADQAARNA